MDELEDDFHSLGIYENFQCMLALTVAIAIILIPYCIEYTGKSDMDVNELAAFVNTLYPGNMDLHVDPTLTWVYFFYNIERLSTPMDAKD